MLSRHQRVKVIRRTVTHGFKLLSTRTATVIVTTSLQPMLFKISTTTSNPAISDYNILHIKYHNITTTTVIKNLTYMITRCA